MVCTFNTNQKVPQFWKKHDSRNCLLKKTDFTKQINVFPILLSSQPWCSRFSVEWYQKWRSRKKKEPLLLWTKEIDDNISHCHPHFLISTSLLCGDLDSKTEILLIFLCNSSCIFFQKRINQSIEFNYLMETSKKKTKITEAAWRPKPKKIPKLKWTQPQADRNTFLENFPLHCAIENQRNWLGSIVGFQNIEFWTVL